VDILRTGTGRKLPIRNSGAKAATLGLTAVLYRPRPVYDYADGMLIESLTIKRAEFESGTGWQIKPEGACKGDICIPLSDPPDGDEIDVVAMANQMSLPLVADEANGLWALGPESANGHTLTSAEAADLRLPDYNGEEFSLSSLRGQKVLMVAWSPY